MTAKNGSTNMELYVVRLSPACRLVWMYLLQHKLPHTLIDVDFSSGENVKVFTEKTSHNEVPVLVDGAVIVFEGPAILRYLAMQYTKLAGFGTDIAMRMTVESLLSWANAELHRVVGPTYAYPSCLERYQLKTESSTDALVDKGLADLAKQLEHLETKYLAKRSYLVGEKLTVADTFVATVILQAEWVGFKFKMWPRVGAWLKRVRAQEFWAKVHAAHRDVLASLEQEGLT